MTVFRSFSDRETELMLKSAEDLRADLICLLDRKCAVGCAQGNAEGHGFLACTELCTAVDVKQPYVLDELSARASDLSLYPADLKLLIAHEREIARGCGELRKGLILYDLIATLENGVKVKLSRIYGGIKAVILRGDGWI